ERRSLADCGDAHKGRRVSPKASGNRCQAVRHSNVQPSRRNVRHRALPARPFLFALATLGLPRRLVELRMKTLLALIGVLAILAAIASAVFFFGGFYSVAATVDDPTSVKWALAKIRLASIRRHATEMPSGSLEDPSMVQAGARAFSERGCLNCHGAPGV